MKKILITGANGFIGSFIINSIVNDNYKIFALVRKTSNIERLKPIIDKINFFYGDVRDKDSLIEPVKNADIVIHCAAVLRCINEITYYEVNHIGTKNLIETIAEYNPHMEGFIYLSSQAAAGPCEVLDYKKLEEICSPVSHYGKSKMLAEQEVLKYSDKIKTIILRPGAVYGPYDKDMFLYFQLAQKGVIPVFNSEFHIQFLFISDLIEILKDILLNLQSFSSNIFFIAEEKCYNIEEIKNVFEKVFKKDIKIIVIPYFIGYLAAYLNEKFYKIFYKKPAVFNRDKLAELSKKFWLCYSSDIKKYLPNFKYTPLEEGIKQTYIWYKENNWL